MLSLSALTALGISLAPLLQAYLAPQAPLAREWSPNVQVAALSAPALQSQPAIGVNGDHTVIAYTDSRNSAPDIYASVFSGGTQLADNRVSNLNPGITTDPSGHAAVAVEASGRAFVAYSDFEQIVLARYEPDSNTWFSRTLVSSNTGWTGVARAPSMASDGNGVLLIAWEDYRNATEAMRSADIYARKCDGATLTCGSEIKLNTDSDGAGQRQPRVALRGSTAVVVWEDHRELGGEAPRIYARISNNAGDTWAADARVNKDASGAMPLDATDSARNPAVTIATDGGVFAAWEAAASTTSQSDIVAARWDGATWSTPTRVDSGAAGTRAIQPAMASSDAGVFAAWTDYRSGSRNPDIFAARWSGSAWVESRVTSHLAPQSNVALGANGASVKAVWEDERNGSQDVFSTDWNGNAWGNEVRVNDTAMRSTAQLFPSLELGPEGITAAFIDMRDGSPQAWLARLDPASQIPAWLPVQSLPTGADTGEVVVATAPDIAMGSGGSLHTSWAQWKSGEGVAIMYATLTAGGWSEPTNVSAGTGETNKNDIDLSTQPGLATVTWVSYGANNQHQIYAAWMKNGVWSTPVTVRSAPGSLYGAHPSSVLDRENRLHVVWGDSEGNGRGKLMLASRDLDTAAGWTYRTLITPLNVDWCGQSNPRITTDASGGLHIAWTGCTLKTPPNSWPHAIYSQYMRSTDGGATWSTPLRLGLTPPTDENDTSSAPALSVASANEVMVLYPAYDNGAYAFFAVLIKDNVAAAPVKVSDGATNWLKPDTYRGQWYPGDSRGAVAYDGARLRFVTAFPDRRNLRTPLLYSATYGELTLLRTFLPLTRR